MALIRVRDKNGNYIDIPALQGESAYDIAVRNGFVGTEQEWLESMGFANYVVLNKLGDSNGKLTYDGKPVGKRATKTVSFTSVGKDFYYVTTAARCFMIDVLEKDGLTAGTEIKSILVKRENDLIDVRDLAIKENEGKPCDVSYLHAYYDNSDVLVDDNGNFLKGVNIASLYFPASGLAHDYFSNADYTEIIVEFYTEDNL